MNDVLGRMSRFEPRGWNLATYEHFGDWATQLEVHKSSALVKHRVALTKLAKLIEELVQPLEVEEEAEEEPEPASPTVTTRGKGKGKAAAVEVEEEEEVVLNDPSVSILFPYLPYFC